MPGKNLKEEFEALLESMENLILTGTLRPRERLVEADLSQMLNVSRYWIRDALKVLEGKGLVKIVPYKGAVVSDLSRKEIEDIFIIRIHLERLAIHLALNHIEPSNIDNLRNIAEEFEAYYECRNIEKMIRCNTKFHDYIFTMADNPSLMQMIVDMRTRLHITRYVAWSSPEVLSRIVVEHRMFIDALAAGDVKTLDELAERHISYSKDHYLTQLERIKGAG